MLDKDIKKKSKKAASGKSKNNSKSVAQKKPSKGNTPVKTKKKTNSKPISKNNNKIKSKTTTTSKKKMIILFIIVILSLFIIASSYYLIKTPKFNIKSIVVEGNNKIKIDDIITKSGIKIGDNVVESLFKANKKDILAMPYISDIKLSINFPSEIKIKVTEMESLYYAYDKEKNVYYRLNEYGIILEVCDKIDLIEKEILVNGITFDDEVKLGTKINDIDFSKIQVYKNIELEFKNIFPKEKITKVNFENSLTRIYINDKIEIILPNDTNLKYNLTVLKEIISNVGDVQGTIDMTKDNPTFIAF
jgi:cell division protein FtsQ